MRPSLNNKLAIGAVALAACAFAGGAYAASSGSSTNSRQAFLDDTAKRLGVTPQHLNDALAGALQDQLNAAVKGGKLTQAQANAIVQRFRQGGGGLPLGAPPLGGGFHVFRFGPGKGPLGAAASYLGLSVQQLADQLGSGASLAQIASSRHKSTTGLENALVSAERTRLEKERAAGAITSAQEQQQLAQIEARVKALVNQTGRLHQFRQRLPGPPGGGPRAFGLPGGPPGAEVPQPPATPAKPS
jgi:hypothetical protein